MRISANNIPKYLNIEIPGDIVFGCDRRIWQAYIFERYVYNKVKIYRENTYPITVKRIQKDVKNEFMGRLIYDLVYLKDIKEHQNVPDLTRVIYDYLKGLEEYGYLQEQTNGHIFYSKFIILDPDSVYEMRFVPKKLPEYIFIEELMKRKDWEGCKTLIRELLVKYNQSQERKYTEALGSLLISVIYKSNGY